jgi:hypothetical protein
MLQFAISGLMRIDYALWVAGSAVMGAFVGVTVIKRIVMRYKRTSPLVLLLGIVLTITTLIVPIFGTYM